MNTLLANLKKYRYLLYELVKKDIKLKYRSSVLGVLWTLLEPLLTMTVLTLVFSNLLGRGEDSFPVYILSGRLLYSYFANGTRTALKSIRKNGKMIGKVYVPKYMYPLSSVLSNYLIFLVSMIALVGVMIFEQVKVTWYLFEALIPLAILMLLTLGVSMFLATLDVFFRDTEYLWSILLMLIMYASAIFYKAESIISASNEWLFKINPLYSVIVNFRNAIFGRPLDMYHLWYSLGFSVVIMAVGTFMFWKKQDDFILYV